MSAYQVLARKWRPKTFSDLVGQQHVVKALQNALDKGRLHHAYLLTGTRGVGKTTIARILAKSLNCEHTQHGEPCGVCETCQAIDSGRFVDVLEIDAASNTGIDNIREVLENAQYAPTAGKYKVYIIDEVHMLSKSAFNAMLKTLEEPPEHVKFILATTDPHKVPITVLSRCLQFVLRNMTVQQIAEHLSHVLKSEQVIYEPAALILLGRAAQGSMRDALSLLDQAIAMGSGSVKETDVREMIGAVDKRYLYELLDYLMQQNGEALIAKAQEMSANAIGFDNTLNDLAMLLQRLALLKTVPTAIAADDPEYERLLHLAHYFSDEQIQLYYQCAIHGKQDLALAPDEYAGFVMTLLRMLAFAPFAAHNTPMHGTIEGTQLHQPSALPETPMAKSPPPLSGSQHTELPPQKQFQQHEMPPLHPSEVKRASCAPIPSQVIEGQDDSSQFDAPSERLPETLSESTSSAHDLPERLPETAFESGESEKMAEVSELTTQSAIPATKLPEPLSEIANPPVDVAPSHVQAAEIMENIEFKPENWVNIVAVISPEISAAQMLLQHLAWVDWRDGVLTLAEMSDKTHKVNAAEYTERIAKALVQKYHIDIQVNICAWQDGQGWETPAMYAERLALERRELARAALSSDVTAQKMMQVFGGKWLDETLVLK